MTQAQELKTGFAGPSNWPCCGVSAVATIAEVPFASVLEYIRQTNGYNEGWKGTTRLTDRLDALDHFGVKFDKQSFNRRWGKTRFWYWALAYAKRDVTYMVDLTGHTIAFRNGMLIDQANPKGIYFAYAGQAGKYGNKAVTSAIEITSVPSKAERQSVLQNAANDLAGVF